MGREAGPPLQGRHDFAIQLSAFDFIQATTLALTRSLSCSEAECGKRSAASFKSCTLTVRKDNKERHCSRGLIAVRSYEDIVSLKAYPQLLLKPDHGLVRFDCRAGISTNKRIRRSRAML